MKQTKIKRILFYVSLIITAVFAHRIISIVLYDLKNLSPYGWGYLAGNIILALVFLTIALAIRRQKNIAP